MPVPITSYSWYLYRFAYCFDYGLLFENSTQFHFASGVSASKSPSSCSLGVAQLGMRLRLHDDVLRAVEGTEKSTAVPLNRPVLQEEGE
ncbi:hypothetical protein PRIPAC_72381 [Pristionchus pacificus]|uniref:Uncharacterized protein n=1 Tax=Pristionchus pacificus TaxID=54126 RepID=A0A2A6C7I0_PRIPA|nr:hypothetical protein PRIPAC_72381 [Pristionchus pacificus]|eukprot:PDM74013.1 hypothetical protein PRIPAC_41369 [Pristionchus pacificus]